LNSRNDKALTPLHLICRRENSLIAWWSLKDEYIKYLLEHGANPVMRGLRGQHLLLTSAYPSKAHSTEAIRALMQTGMDLEQKHNQGQAALHIAASTRSLKDVEELLEMGANVNTPDEKGLTTLHLAVRTWDGSEARYHCVEVLLKAGADINSIII